MIPKWDQEARFPRPTITYIPDELSCIGIKNTDATIDCELVRDFKQDKVLLKSPFKKEVTPADPAHPAADGDAGDD